MSIMTRIELTESYKDRIKDILKKLDEATINTDINDCANLLEDVFKQYTRMENEDVVIVQIYTDVIKTLSDKIRSLNKGIMDTKTHTKLGKLYAQYLSEFDNTRYSNISLQVKIENEQETQKSLATKELIAMNDEDRQALLNEIGRFGNKYIIHAKEQFEKAIKNDEKLIYLTTEKQRNIGKSRLIVELAIKYKLPIFTNITTHCIYLNNIAVEMLKEGGFETGKVSCLDFYTKSTIRGAKGIILIDECLTTDEILNFINDDIKFIGFTHSGNNDMLQVL